MIAASLSLSSELFAVLHAMQTVYQIYTCTSKNELCYYQGRRLYASTSTLVFINVHVHSFIYTRSSAVVYIFT